MNESLFFDVEAAGVRLKVFTLAPESPAGRSSRKSVSPLTGIHTHFAHEIFFVISALELVTEDGSRTLERSVLIVPPGVGHYTVRHSGENVFLLFTAEDPRLLSALREVAVMPISEAVVFYIQQYRKKCDAGDTESAGLLLRLVFGEVVSGLLPQARSLSTEPAQSRHISAIERYINRHVREKITLGDISREIYLGSKQISRIIRKEYGMSFPELIAEKKLAVAEMLLKNTDLKIAEVARQVNFGAENYFYAVFKKKYGISPLQFRKEFAPGRE